MATVCRRVGLIAVAASLAAGCHRGPTPAEHGLVRVSLPHEIASLDPHVRNSLAAGVIASHFYDRLVDTDADLRIRPALAESWSTPDARTWVFKMRAGVRFHDGRPLRAQDAAWSIKRLLADRELEMSAYVSYVSDVRAVDSLTLEVKTRQPYSILLNRLRFVFIVPEGLGTEALAEKAIGTGPYRLEQWVHGQRMRLVRNETYWGPPPALAELELLLQRGPEEAAQDLVTGRSRLVQCNSREAERRVRLAGFTVQRQPSMSVKYVAFGFASETIPGPQGPLPNPFHKLEVRQAVHLALDRPRLVARLPTAAVPATQPVPPSIFGFSPAIPAAVHDHERARELLRAAGYRDGLRAPLFTRNMLTAAAREVRTQLAEVGIELDVHELGESEFLDRARRLEFPLYLSRLGAVTGDATNLLENGLHTVDTAHGMGVANFGGYSNPEIDRAIEESALAEGPGPRRAALEQIMQRLMVELPWAPLYVDEDVFAMAPGLAWRPRRDGFVLAAEIGLSGS